MFLYFWTIEIEPFDRFDRFFRLIKRPDRQFIFPSDFDPFLKELLKYHPGLEFLETAPVSIYSNIYFFSFPFFNLFFLFF